MTEPPPGSPLRLTSRDRDAIISSLRAGVVPRRGFAHIQVGRADEIAALGHDLDRVSGGGSMVRFVIGDYGAGKTFFLNLVASMATEKKLVTASADLTPDRRLHGSGGQGRALYAELMRNLSTRATPNGGALPGVVERFITTALTSAREHGIAAESVIVERLTDLSQMVGGYDFAYVIGRYWEAYDTGNDHLKADVIRWLRGEFSTKTDARNALGIRTIIDDSNFYDTLKLLALFVRLAGFTGLVICFDEMVNVYKLANTLARNGNYEQVLRIVNDCLQGNAARLGFIFAGTPEFLMDTRKGLYSYEALRSRLAENNFAVGGLVDHTGPVLRLANLTPEDMYVLLIKLRHVYAGGDTSRYPVPDDALTAFMEHCASRVGDAYFRTPRTTIREFLNLLAVLGQNEGLDWRVPVGKINLVPETNPDLEPLPEDVNGLTFEPVNPPAAARPSDDDLTTFRL
jgi:bacteriophage exclusion system BrxC/D-like protein